MWKNKKVLVTGGAGFIGSALAKKLCKMNVEVVIIDDFSYGCRSNIPPHCEVRMGNVLDINVFHKMEDIDYIFHFGSPSSVVLFNEKPMECMSETVIGLMNIFEYAKKNSVKKVIYPSSGTVYGHTSLPQSEILTIPRPINLYGVSKLTCEHIARYYSSYIPNIGLRIFAGYGPEEKHKGRISSVITLFLNDILNNKRPVIWGNGTQSRDFIYIDDVVNIIISSATNSFSGVVNVGTGQSYTFNQVVKIINNIFGKNLSPYYIKKPLNYYEHTLPDISRMLRIYNISPVNLQTGLKKYKEVLENEA